MLLLLLLLFLINIFISPHNFPSTSLSFNFPRTRVIRTCRLFVLFSSLLLLQIALKPAHFDESKSLVDQYVNLEGTAYNIEHPDDVAARKALEADPSNKALLQRKLTKELPQLNLQYFCRQVPLAGQCDHCRAVMRDPLADAPVDDEDLAQQRSQEVRGIFFF